MNRIWLHISFLIIVLLSFVSAKAQNNCDTKALKKELYQLLKPNYRYDKSKVSQIVIKEIIQGGEIGVPLLNTEKYRLLFNTAGFPVDIDIKIYDKKMGSKNRTLLYSIKDEMKEGQTTFFYKPPLFSKPKTIYIDYIVPAVSDEKMIGIEGCVVFLIGYKIG